MLSIDDVTSKRFSESHLHSGYEMTEVDRFMAEVAEALYERDEEIAKLRQQLTGPRRRAETPAEAVITEPANLRVMATTAEPGIDGVGAPAGTADHDACVSAVRVLEIATANAKQLVNEAKIEGDAVLTAARAAADQLTAASRDEAARLSAELEQQRQTTESQLQDYRAALLAGLAEQEAALQQRIKDLQSLEVRQLTDLHGYLTDQLAQVQLRSSALGLTLNGTAADGADTTH